VHAGDVGDPSFCQQLVAGLVADRGRVDYLVNNAGLLIENSVAKMTASQWEQALRVNLSAPFHLAQAAIAPMAAQGGGRIVNVGSVTAAMGNPVEAGYGAAKAGLLGLTRSLARAVARKGITVNLVVPGVFDTEMTQSMRPKRSAR
jgi:NAD(P)-dependent dehydrogenase (short-subunit alcohol dehydrogenase family)